MFIFLAVTHTANQYMYMYMTIIIIRAASFAPLEWNANGQTKKLYLSNEMDVLCVCVRLHAYSYNMNV